VIITQTPLRVSFLGGGTDLSSFYHRRKGCVLSVAIDKYCYLALHPFFYRDKIQLKYSKTELVQKAEEIQHPILRAVVQRFGIRGIDINSISDVPASTGLGSSSAFTVGVLHALYAYTGKYVAKSQLAREACDIEINELREPIGKQDQYASAFGGLNLISFHSDESVSVEPVVMPPGKLRQMQDHLMVFFTGVTRSASSVLQEQRQNTIQDPRTFEALCQLAEMAEKLRDDLSSGNVDALGKALHEGWLLKQKLAKSIANDVVSSCYRLAMDNGAVGGKLLGAGGGGFLLLFVYPDARERLRRAMSAYQELSFSFDTAGTRIIHVGE
jgi:D-glycero-alpha-D-manno-heptose-7-phosphate kinase